MIPHAIQAERDIAGTAVASLVGAQVVGELVHIDHFYDKRVAHIIEASLTVPAKPIVDLSGLDTGILIGPHIVARGMAFTDEVLHRVVAVGNIVDESPIRVAELVADLPCRPSRTFVEALVAEIEDAALRRAALVVLAEAEMRLKQGVPFSDAITSVRELVSS